MARPVVVDDAMRQTHESNLNKISKLFQMGFDDDTYIHMTWSSSKIIQLKLHQNVQVIHSKSTKEMHFMITNLALLWNSNL